MDFFSPEAMRKQDVKKTFDIFRKCEVLFVKFYEILFQI